MNIISLKNFGLAFLGLICLCVYSLSVTAQYTPSHSFKIEEEHFSPTIKVVYQKKNGYILCGTTHGLYSFDGLRFAKIPFNNPSSSDTVTSIFEDKDRTVWVGMQSGRIAHVLGGSLQYWQPEEGTPAQPITAFAQDSLGIIWFSSRGEGVYYYSKNKLYLVNEENGLSDMQTGVLMVTRKGDILVATDNGINCITLTNGKAQVKVIGPSEGLPDYMVTAIADAGNNQYWIGLQDKGFCKYNHSTGNISTPPMHWKYGQVNQILQFHDHVWLGTDADGVIRYSLKNGRLDSLTLSHTTSSILSFCYDAQDNLWIATQNAGLVRSAGEKVRILPMPANTDFEHIHALLRSNDGALWTTDPQNRLLRIRFLATGNEVEPVALSGLTPKTDITCLYQDISGRIWVGTMGRGVYLLDPISLRYRSVDELSHLNDGSILSITGRDKRVYVSSLQGCVSVDINKSSSDLNGKMIYKNLDISKLGNNYVYTIFEDTKGRLWFATDGDGLIVYENGKLTGFDKTNGLIDARIYSICEDFDGNIWFSTASAGIYKYNGKSFVNYGFKNGLTSLNISGIKTDVLGNIIIVHEKGLDVLNPKTEKLNYINENHGVTGINVQDLGCISQDNNGNIYMIGVDGIIKYAPFSAIALPKTILDQVQLFEQVLSEDSTYTFKHDENSFTFLYSGLFYASPGDIVYQYRLEGLDTVWTTTKDRMKTFTRLPPGKYTFRVRSSLNKNFDQASEAAFSFEIKQVFYKTAWFIILCVFALIVLLYSYIFFREKRIKRMESLKQASQVSKFELLKNQVNPHFLFNSFNTLISTIEEDPKVAVEYAERLSDFFRNIVAFRDKDVTTLSEELSMLENYFFLQQKRYGNNISLAINIPKEIQKNIYVAPLTLQLLLENAIKHNAVQREKPLHISLSVSGDDYILIQNNIIPRSSKSLGAGMGLQNIINRYTFLSSHPVKVFDNGQVFIVSIPFIKFKHD